MWEDLARSQYAETTLVNTEVHVPNSREAVLYVYVHSEKEDYSARMVRWLRQDKVHLITLSSFEFHIYTDVDITHPMFSSSTGGLSSFTAYTLPTEIQEDIMIGFKFIPHDMEQISLMLFIGQDGYHGPSSDHLAVSFIKGYVVLTWNLGSGPRRIFTTQPVSDTGTIFHVVKIGRIGQRAWLAVDNQRNVTGKSPGKLSQLNTRPIVYVGGHDSMNFSLLPHDLPLHTGFSGCLFDVEINSNTNIVKLEKNLASFSRGVGQCGSTLCNEEACENGGGCINHGATYT